MKLLKIIFLSILFFYSNIIFAKNEKTILKDMRAISKVDKKNIEKVYGLLIRVGNSLEKDMDKKVLIEFARILEMLFKVDSNYYTVEFFAGVIKKHEKEFLIEMKRNLSKKDYELLDLNIQIFKREINQGNG